MIRFAMLGTGGIARHHARRLSEHPEAEVVALCDVSTDVTGAFAAKNFADQADGLGQFDDVGRMFAETELDAVLIASPHTLHYEHATQALEAGCHCFIEKPMVTSAPHAYALSASAEHAQKIVAVGYNTPCTSAFEYLRTTIRSERLGRLELVNGYISQSWYAATEGKWRRDPSLSGGGQAYDSGAHFLCSVVWTVESPVARLCAMVDNKDTAVDINSVMNVTFENGVMAALTIGGNSVHWGSGAAFVFEQGVIEIDAWNGKWIREYTKRDRTETVIDLPPDPGHALDNFIDAVQGRAEPRTTPRDGILQSELMDAIYHSAATGQIVSPQRAAE